MKHRSNLAPLGAAAALAVGAQQLFDLLTCTDPATGFVTDGPASLRWGLWLVFGALTFLLSRAAAARPAGLVGRCVPLGACMLLTAAAQAYSAVAALYHELAAAGVGNSRMTVLTALLELLSAVWFAVFGLRAIRGFSARRGLPPAVCVLPTALYFFWTLVLRFQVVPAAADRLPCTLRVLSAAAALLLVSMLAKIFLVPGLPGGQSVSAAGLLAFGYGTCLELPRALYETFHGVSSFGSLDTALTLGALGLCGLVCAWYAMGPDTLPEE